MKEKESEFQVGVIVRLRTGKRIAAITKVSEGKAQNMVMLDRRLGGSILHNINDLEVVAKRAK